MRNARLGLIIKLIANKPGITMTVLLNELGSRGVNVTERTLAKDIVLLKNEYSLLPKKERLRSGYVLQDMCTLSDKELELVLDAMHVFGLRLNDLEAKEMLERIGRDIATPKGRNGGVAHSRTLGHRDIYRKATVGQDIENIVMSAIRTRKPVAMTYQTPRLAQAQNTKGYPLFLVFHERGWYCIVKDLDAPKYHPRRLDRIKTCSLLKDGEENLAHLEHVREAQFLMSCGWGMTFPRSVTELEALEEQAEIVVRFDRTVAPYIMEAAERHPRGKIKPTKDGTGDVEFKISLAADSAEFQNWVRSFGSKAWFVSPASLVEREKTEVRRMARRYGLS